MIRGILRFLRVFIAALVARPGPKIFLVSPLGGWPGSFVTIDGSGFSTNIDDNGVEIGGVPALIVRAATNRLQVIVGETAVSGPVRVSVNGISATAGAVFDILPWPEVRDGREGPPKFFHGPQHGTPALWAQDQRVLVMMCAPKDDVPIQPWPERADEQASFAEADRFWREASYHRTSFKFEFSSWLDLPQNRSFYIWSQVDVDWARFTMLRWSKRCCAVAGNRLLATNLLGVFSIVNISNPDAPFEITNMPALDKPMHVVVHGAVAYVASGDGGLFVLNLTPAIPTIITHTPTPGVWLHALDVSGNTLVAAAYAAGLQIYDVTNPNNPQIRSTLAFAGRWATCVRLVGNRAYVGANSNAHPNYGATVRIVDVSNPSAPFEIGAVNIANSRAWVLGIDVIGNTCVAATDGDGLQVFDVSGGVPVLRGVEKSTLRLHDVKLAGTVAYGAGADAGFIAWDVSNTAIPKKTGGFPTMDCFGVTVSGGRAFLSLGSIWLLVANLPNPQQPAPGSDIALMDGNWMPPAFGLGAPSLRQLLRNAIQYQNLIKHDALYVHAIQRMKAVFGTNIDVYEGIICVVHGTNGRAQSGPKNEVWFEGVTIKFNGTKGMIWLPAKSSWGRKAHEIGHWFNMPDTYEEVQSDGTILAGTAQFWDMAGDVDTASLFCGRQADSMRLFDPANIVRREWQPGTGPQHEPFEIVAHDLNEVPGGRIHLLELIVADGLSYFVEVRQKPGVVIFDKNIPLPAGAPHDGAVLVTRSVTSETFFNNTFERSTMLFGVLTTGQSVLDPPRLLRIEAVAILNPRPLTYRVIVHWNEVPPDTPDGPIDLSITPWNIDTWETPDVWINSELNDLDKTPAGRRYEFCEPGKPELPVLNGDRPWIKRPNTVFARIHNSGPQPANNVLVSFATTSPPGIGDNGRTPDGKLIAWVTQDIKTIPVIAPNKAEVVEFSWTPKEDKHTCMLITISPQLGEKETQDNNSARENVAAFDSRGGSSHEPILLDAEVRSPFSVVRKVNLIVRGLPDGWHAVVDHEWTWVEPQGTKPVRVVAWTDLHSPRSRDHREIPSFAAPRVEGWTDLDHLIVPIGGILMPIRANARARLAMEVRLAPQGLIVEVAIDPVSSGVPIAAEITDRLAERAVLHGATDSAGRVVLSGRFPRGTYLVQAFSGSTAQVGAAETEQRTFVIP